MNKVILMGRLTRDPDVRYSQGANATAVARYSLAVDRRFKRDGQPDADFFNCVSFGKQAEFVEKYLHKGIKVVIQGSLQNDNYQNREGQMVYRDQIMIDNIEFAESKNASSQGSVNMPEERPDFTASASDGFMNIPDGVDDELPFSD